MCPKAFQPVQFARVFPGLGLGRTLHLLQPPLDRRQVGQDQLCVYGFDVVNGIQVESHVGDITGLKAAHDHSDGVHVADVAQELVAQPLTPVRALDQPGNVHETNRRRHDLFRPHEGCYVRQAAILNRHNTDVWLNGSKGIAGHGRPGSRQRVKEGRLAHVGQPDDADFQGHGATPMLLYAFDVR